MAQAKKKRPKHIPTPPPLSRLERLRSNRHTPRLYLLGTALVLMLTSVLWGILGARLQNDNADQLVDSYLFENSQTAHGASFPGQHTFLFKWPLFWLQHLFGYSSGGFIVATVLVVLLTVGGLMYLLWRIERRPYALGLLYLALASVLLVVPPVPYAGALLPTNFAMLTTRNLEYLLYAFGLVLVAQSLRIRSWRFIGGVACLGLLFASDRLFGTLSLGGAVLAIGIYTVVPRKNIRTVALRWLLATIAALAVATIMLSLLNASGVVHIVSQSATSPYGLVPNIRAFLLGTVYVGFALLTNFGANPASSATTLANAPHTATTQLLSLGGLSYVVNLCLLALGILSCVYVIRQTLASTPAKNNKKLPPTRIATLVGTMLIYSTVAAVASYVITNHYYLVDSRYVAIELLAILVASTVYIRTKHVNPKFVVLASCIVLLAIGSGAYAVFHDDKANTTALQTQRDRTSLIVAALAGHHAEVVVGNYWRVLPVKLASSGHQTVLPLASCTAPRTVLTSSAWQPNLRGHSFAYVLTLDTADRDFTDCTLEKVTTAYGKPNASAIIAGTTEKPQEIILFYDKGIHHGMVSPTASQFQSENTLRPVMPKKIRNTKCAGHRTILQIAAHEDDDLLFMNPDLLHTIRGGDCVRTVYLTAGDAGSGKFYWLGREQGSEAAYGLLGRTTNVWVEQTVKFADHQFATVASPAMNHRLSLVFMHLPDGSPNGEGFSASNFESLAKLEADINPSIHTVDRQSFYDSKALLATITALIDVYQPDEIRTQLPYSANSSFVDHSDHMAVGRYVKEASATYLVNHPASSIKYYLGYPVHAYAPNVSDPELSIKEQAFFAYSQFDNAACSSPESCVKTGVYDAYLSRQYRIDQLSDQ